MNAIGPTRPARRDSLRARARVALATFVAAVLVTLVAPFVAPAADGFVCTAHAATVDHGTGGLPSPADHAAHCPLCMPAGGPPPAFFAMPSAPVLVPVFVASGVPPARLASLVGAPLPPRGPPPVS